MKNKNLALVAVLFTISVIMAFANGPTPQVVIDTDQIVDGAVTILKTDGVAANDLSNVTPATGRTALGLGTMAVATSTDYVATDTFTGHTDATGASVHGLGTISTKADTDYVATSSLAERLDTTNASISNNLDVVGNVGAATVNGVAPLTADEKTQALVGLATVDHAAKNIVSSGNTETAYSGRGGVSSSKIQLRSECSATVATYTVGVFTSAGGAERFTYLGKMLVKGLGGSEEYTVLLEAGSDAGNTTIAVTTGPTVTASALVGTPDDIVASYSVTGAALTLTVYVPQTYHTINMTNQFADTGVIYCNWSD